MPGLRNSDDESVVLVVVKAQSLFTDLLVGGEQTGDERLLAGATDAALDVDSLVSFHDQDPDPVAHLGRLAQELGAIMAAWGGDCRVTVQLSCQ